MDVIFAFYSVVLMENCFKALLSMQSAVHSAWDTGKVASLAEYYRELDNIPLGVGYRFRYPKRPCSGLERQNVLYDGIAVLQSQRTGHGADIRRSTKYQYNVFTVL